MKKWFFLIIIFLIQSCFSYKTTDNNSENQQFDTSKKYELKIGDNNVVVKNLRIQDKNYHYTYKNKERSVPVKDVRSVKERKFSVTKTVGLVLAISAATTLVTIHALDNLGIEIGK